MIFPPSFQFLCHTKSQCTMLRFVLQHKPQDINLLYKVSVVNSDIIAFAFEQGSLIIEPMDNQAQLSQRCVVMLCHQCFTVVVTEAHHFSWHFSFNCIKGNKIFFSPHISHISWCFLNISIKMHIRIRETMYEVDLMRSTDCIQSIK